MALSGRGIIITYPDGRFVSLHTVCSLILPSDHNGGHTSMATQSDNSAKHAPRSYTNTAGCSSAWPRMDDLVRLRSGHLVWKRPNRAQQVLKWLPHRQLLPWVYHPFSSSLPCKAFFFLVRGRQAITEPSQQLPSACWNEPQHHYLTHSRASGNQRESFELCRESGLTSSTDGR